METLPYESLYDIVNYLSDKSLFRLYSSSIQMKKLQNIKDFKIHLKQIIYDHKYYYYNGTIARIYYNHRLRKCNDFVTNKYVSCINNNIMINFYKSVTSLPLTNNIEILNIDNLTISLIGFLKLKTLILDNLKNDKLPLTLEKLIVTNVTEELDLSYLHHLSSIKIHHYNARCIFPNSLLMLNIYFLGISIETLPESLIRLKIDCGSRKSLLSKCQNKLSAPQILIINLDNLDFFNIDNCSTLILTSTNSGGLFITTTVATTLGPLKNNDFLRVMDPISLDQYSNLKKLTLHKHSGTVNLPTSIKELTILPPGASVICDYERMTPDLLSLCILKQNTNTPLLIILPLKLRQLKILSLRKIIIDKLPKTLKTLIIKVDQPSRICLRDCADCEFENLCLIQNIRQLNNDVSKIEKFNIPLNKSLKKLIYVAGHYDNLTFPRNLEMLQYNFIDDYVNIYHVINNLPYLRKLKLPMYGILYNMKIPPTLKYLEIGINNIKYIPKSVKYVSITYRNGFGELINH